MTNFNDDQYYQYPPYGFAPRPFSHGALGTQDQDTFVFSNVGKGPKGDKGDIGLTGPQGPRGPKGEKGDTGNTLRYEDMSKEDKQNLISQVARDVTMSASQMIEEVYYTVNEDEQVIPIPSEFSPFDILFVDVEGLDLVQGVDYSINHDNEIVLASPITHSGTRVAFKILRASIPEGNKHILNCIVPSASGTVDNSVGIPSVSITANKKGELHFYFHNIKGEQGEQGEQGVQGEPLLFEDLTQEQLDNIYENVSFVGTVAKYGSYTTTESDEDRIPIGINDLDPDDILFVTIDGKLLTQGVDYIVDDDYLVLTEPIADPGTMVYIRALGYAVPDGDKNIIINQGSVVSIPSSDINSIVLDDQAIYEASKYLNESGLTYLWNAIKQYFKTHPNKYFGINWDETNDSRCYIVVGNGQSEEDLFNVLEVRTDGQIVQRANNNYSIPTQSNYPFYENVMQNFDNQNKEIGYMQIANMDDRVYRSFVVRNPRVASPNNTSGIYVTVYDDGTGLAELTNGVAWPVKNGGTGMTGVRYDDVARNIFTPANGVTVVHAQAAKWGRVVSILVDWKYNKAINVPANGNISDIDIGTISYDYRAQMTTSGESNGDDAGAAWYATNSTGILVLCACEGTGSARTIPANTIFHFRATYVTLH